MRRAARWVLWMPAILLAGSLAMAQQPAKTAGTDADVAAIKELTREVTAGFNSGDLDRVMKFYADNYVDVNLRRPRQSKQERREYYRKILERHDTKIEVTPEEIIVSGKHAFARGTLIVIRTPSDGGPPKRTELRYIEIWQKFADGWKSIWGMDAELYPDEKQ